MSKPILLLGPVGSGAMPKLINSFLCGVQVASLAEAISMIERSGLDRAKAAYEEAVARYRSQVLVAFHEVEDGLAGLRLLKEQFDAQSRAVVAAKQVADLSRNRYKEGLASYFEVVLADRTALENQILAYQLNGQRIVTTILLIKALGGGWKADNAMMTKSVTPLKKAD